MPEIIQAIWNTKTYNDWIASGITKLHHSRRFKFAVNTIVLCINKDTRSIFGVAVLKSTCKEHHLLDTDVYQGEYAKYNKYECDIIYRPFPKPILCKTVNEMCKADPHNKVWYNFRFTFVRCRLATENVLPDIKKRFEELVMTW